MSNEFEKPSQEFVRNQLNLLTMEQRTFLFGFINLNKHNLEISWDLDQILEITEDSVKAISDAELGTNYFERRIDGWNSISNWLIEDKILNPEDALKHEKRLWLDNDVVMMGPPNKKLRCLSFVAKQRNIKQSVTTVRVPGLRQTTYRWLGAHFPWIAPGDINIKIGMYPPGPEYKIAKILEIHKRNPALIHVDDDLKIIKPLAKLAPTLGIIGIRYPSDDLSDMEYADNRVFLDRDTLSSLIYYSPFAEDMVAQCY